MAKIKRMAIILFLKAGRVIQDNGEKCQLKCKEESNSCVEFVVVGTEVCPGN
jgi:hypothetical protein